MTSHFPARAHRAAAMMSAAIAPAARADDPYLDIYTDVQSSITAGEADFSAAATDFSTAGDTNEGLLAVFSGFDNIFIGPADYVLVGLTDAATGTDASGLGPDFLTNDSGQPLTVAGQEAIALSDANAGAIYAADASDFFSSGNAAQAAFYEAFSSYDYTLASQAATDVATQVNPALAALLADLYSAAP
jgi:hypothetical protein